MAANVTQFGSPGIGRRPGLFAWLLLVPLLVWLVLFVISPTIMMAVYSFGQPDALGQVQFSQTDSAGNPQSLVTINNYKRIITGPQILALLTSAAIGSAAAALVWTLIHKTGLRHSLGTSSFTLTLGTFLLIPWVLLNAYVLDWRIGGVDGFGFVSVFPFTVDAERSNWLKIFIVSINYAAISTAICIVAGYPVAYFIGKAPEKWRNMLLMLVMVPFWTSFLVRTYAWVTILRSEGVLNAALLNIGLISEPLDLYPSQTAVMIGLVYTYLPFMILPIYSSIERLDNAFVEAAFDLGASPLRAFNHVIFPLTRPGVVAGVLLVFIPALGMFAVNDILGGKQEMLIGNVIQEQFGRAKNPPFGAALGMLLLVLFIITYYLMTSRRERAGN